MQFVWWRPPFTVKIPMRWIQPHAALRVSCVNIEKVVLVKGVSQKDCKEPSQLRNVFPKTEGVSGDVIWSISVLAFDSISLHTGGLKDVIS